VLKEYDAKEPEGVYIALELGQRVVVASDRSPGTSNCQGKWYVFGNHVGFPGDRGWFPENWSPKSKGRSK
jgi:hypothetical protein